MDTKENKKLNSKEKNKSFKKIYNQYNNELHEKLKDENNFPTLEIFKEYLYCEKAGFSGFESSMWIWNVIACVLAFVTLVFSNYMYNIIVVFIVIAIMMVFCVIGVIRNIQLAQNRVRLVCVEKWLSEIESTTLTTINIKKNVIKNNSIF